MNDEPSNHLHVWCLIRSNIWSLIYICGVLYGPTYDHILTMCGALYGPT